MCKPAAVTCGCQLYHCNNLRGEAVRTWPVDSLALALVRRLGRVNCTCVACMPYIDLSQRR